MKILQKYNKFTDYCIKNIKLKKNIVKIKNDFLVKITKKIKISMNN